MIAASVTEEQPIRPAAVPTTVARVAEERGVRLAFDKPKNVGLQTQKKSRGLPPAFSFFRLPAKDQPMSYRSRFITLFQAATNSRTNLA
jgi:hypothetical protein